jgi:hypothetical protein
MNRIQAMALLSVTAFSATIAPTATSQERMHAGLWEMTTTKGGATVNTGTRCFTAEETAGNNGDAKALRDTLEKSFAKASCVVKDMAAIGKSISYVVDCGSGASAHTLSSVAEYRGDTMEIQFTVKRGTSAETTLTKGHRVGACT